MVVLKHLEKFSDLFCDFFQSKRVIVEEPKKFNSPTEFAHDLCMCMKREFKNSLVQMCTFKQAKFDNGDANITCIMEDVPLALIDVYRMDHLNITNLINQFNNDENLKLNYMVSNLFIKMRESKCCIGMLMDETRLWIFYTSAIGEFYVSDEINNFEMSGKVLLSIYFILRLAVLALEEYKKKCRRINIKDGT